MRAFGCVSIFELVSPAIANPATVQAVAPVAGRFSRDRPSSSLGFDVLLCGLLCVFYCTLALRLTKCTGIKIIDGMYQGAVDQTRL